VVATEGLGHHRRRHLEDELSDGCGSAGLGRDTVIPEKDDQKANRKRKGSAGGRPVTYDKDAYKRRNVVERSFNTLRQWRSLATRYDKLALTDRSATVLHAVVIWSTLLGDAP
jgi:transposase